jgi:hypothetical protein
LLNAETQNYLFSAKNSPKIPRIDKSKRKTPLLHRVKPRNQYRLSRYSHQHQDILTIERTLLHVIAVLASRNCFRSDSPAYRICRHAFVALDAR